MDIITIAMVAGFSTLFLICVVLVSLLLYRFYQLDAETENIIRGARDAREAATDYSSCEDDDVV